MAIYGTALLAICLLVGLMLGRMLGLAVGVDADIGGVGIAMLLLILCTDRMHVAGRMKPPTESGIVFWGSIYVPVVVAMAASQNVFGAMRGGLMATAAGVAGVVACFLVLALFAKLGAGGAEED